MAAAPKARPAHAPGPTFLTYTPNGHKLVTVGANDTIRIFETGSDAEPINVDQATDGNTAVVATNQFFITGSEDGSVNKYSLETSAFDQLLTRCTLPIRDLALSPDKQWVAVCGDDMVVKIVHVDDMTRVRTIRDLPKPVKHLTFDYTGDLLMCSCTDGCIYVHDVSPSKEPTLLHKLDDMIGALESESQHSSRVIWHPDGRAFALPTPTRDIQVVAKKQWQPQKAFKYGHTGLITALAWSPNGALLVTAGVDRSISLWDTKTQKVIHQIGDLRAPAWAFSWHPTENILSYTNDSGELYIHTDFVPAQYTSLLQAELQSAPMNNDPLSEVSGNAVRQPVNGHAEKDLPRARRERSGTPNSLDEILGPDDDDEWSNLGGFVEDDDGQGYAEQFSGHRKRTNDHLDDPQQGITSKRRAVWQPQIHESFQPGSTPWRGNRRYLCLNLIGFIWTVDQDTHNTVTVEFYDREFNRDFHFTDPYGYDKACLTEKGALFACQPRGDQNAMLFYRPHETWTTRPDWRTELPKGETITSIALSDSYIVATTSTEYVRVFTLFGTPIRVSRHKSSPIVTCASFRDYILTIGNGPVCSTGQTRLTYTIDNPKRDETSQSEDTVALPGTAQLHTVFFSDAGDPCIYDSHGVLLVLQHWRTPHQARWTPLLDTRSLARLASGRKSETYWPVAVANNKFYCIILKGGDRYPYFPRPLLAEFDFEIPLRHAAPSAAPKALPSADSTADGADTETNADHDADTDNNTADHAASQIERLEQSFVLSSVLHSLAAEQVAATSATSAQRAALGASAVEIDKVLLQLLAAECVEGEDRGMKALEIVRLMRDESGRILEAAGKVAARFGREVLRGKIEELAERRVVGLDTGDDD